MEHGERLQDTSIPRHAVADDDCSPFADNRRSSHVDPCLGAPAKHSRGNGAAGAVPPQQAEQFMQPVGGTPRDHQQHHHPLHHPQQQHDLEHQAPAGTPQHSNFHCRGSTSKQASGLRRLFGGCCGAPAVAGEAPAAAEHALAAQCSSGSAISHEARRNSGDQQQRRHAHGLYAHVLKQQHSNASQYTETEWHDALSQHSSDIAQHMSDLDAFSSGGYGRGGSDVNALGGHCHASRAVEQVPASLPPHGPWVPDPPLLFAEPGMTFVPVPAVTGVAGTYVTDHQRTTPFPQPLDVMAGVNIIVHKVHASIKYMVFTETESQLVMATNPSFLPKGLPAAYTETYSKVPGSTTTWNMRRDLALGHTRGQLYFTSCGVLVQRVTFYPLIGKTPTFTVEDYIMLTDGGATVVCREAGRDLKTGRSAMQFQVGMREGMQPAAAGGH